MSDAFTRLLGTRTGRIAPAGVAPPLGNFVLCLGSDVEDDTATLLLNDGMQVQQTADVTGLTVVRFRLICRPPKLTVAGCKWVVKWGIVGGPEWSRDLLAARAFDLRDVAIPVDGFTGNQTLRVQLRLVAG